MKKIFSLLVVAAGALAMVACTPSHDKTIANLKAAIDGESTAAAKYAAFADQAAADSLYNVEAMFRATAQAETVHIKNHQEVLVSLGIADYVGTAAEFEVKTTAENIQAAIDGETHEFTEMYPGFIADAQAEKVDAAVVSFTYAQDAEKGHAAIYGEALANIATPEVIAAAYFVCPKCGNTYAGTAADVCEFCQTSSADFIAFNATMPIAPVEEGAEVAVEEAAEPVVK
ncbi:MAG: ferritin family protein [Alistipes sp.]